MSQRLTEMIGIIALATVALTAQHARRIVYEPGISIPDRLLPDDAFVIVEKT